MSTIWGQLALISQEITTTDPARYAGMSNAQAAAELNRLVETGAEHTEISGSELFEAIEQAEYAALSAAQRERVQLVLRLGDSIKIGPGSRARAWLLDAFAAGSATRANLLALVQRLRSRAEVIGLVGKVEEAHIESARGGATTTL